MCLGVWREVKLFPTINKKKTPKKHMSNVVYNKILELDIERLVETSSLLLSNHCCLTMHQALTV